MVSQRKRGFRRKGYIEESDYNTLFKKPMYEWLDNIFKQKIISIFIEKYIVPLIIILILILLFLKYGLNMF